MHNSLITEAITAIDDTEVYDWDQFKKFAQIFEIMGF